MQSTDTKLLDCPCCDGTAIFTDETPFRSVFYRTYIKCKKCGLRTGSSIEYYKDSLTQKALARNQVINVWHSRLNDRDDKTPNKPIARRYHVVFVRNDDRKEIIMSRENEPMTHQEACTFKSKMVPHSHGYHMLKEAGRTKT